MVDAVIAEQPKRRLWIRHPWAPMRPLLAIWRSWTAIWNSASARTSRLRRSV